MCRLTISALKPAHWVAVLPVPALFQEQGGNVNRGRRRVLEPAVFQDQRSVLRLA